MKMVIDLITVMIFSLSNVARFMLYLKMKNHGQNKTYEEIPNMESDAIAEHIQNKITYFGKKLQKNNIIPIVVGISKR